jgi:hypothetical protein
MMKKTNQPAAGVIRSLFVLLCALVCINSTKAQSGISCASAHSFNVQPDSCSNDTVSSSSEMWFTFKPQTTQGEIRLISPDHPDTAYQLIELFSGNCSGLQLLFSSVADNSMEILLFSGLNTAQTYYLKISKSNTFPSNFSICYRSISNILNCNECPTSGCQLVCNPDMELYSFIPLNAGQIAFVSCWTQPHSSSSTEFYSMNSTDANLSPPLTGFGYQNTHSGANMGGFSTYIENPPQGTNYREYIQARVAQPLLAGKYRVSFYVSLANSSKRATGNMGAYISTIRPLQSTTTWGPLNNLTPQIVYSSIISDTTNWVLVTDTFTASGGEMFITIGNFDRDNVQPRQNVQSAMNTQSNFAYYFIDDFVLAPYKL